MIKADLQGVEGRLEVDDPVKNHKQDCCFIYELTNCK